MAFPDIIRELTASNKVLVTSHIRPDGDAIGSLMGTIGLLRALGKKAYPVLQDPVPDKYQFVPGSSEIMTVEAAEKYAPFDSAVFLDAGEFNRIGEVQKYVTDDMKIINIDHHVSNDGFGDASWIDGTASATAEMLHKIFREFQIKPDPDTAMALYTGIMTDTGRFRFANTSSRVLASAAALVECGADPVLATEKTYYDVRMEDLKALGNILSRVELFVDNKIATTYLTPEDQNADTEGFVDFIIAIRGVEVAAMFHQIEKDFFKISLRSTGDVDVAELAAAFNGGGHRKAAGCRLALSYEEAQSTILEAFKKVL